jgi:predicted bacteriocin transport accessory protein
MKIIQYCLLLFTFLVLVACQEEEESFKLNPISESKLTEEVESKETFLLVLGEKYCTSCQDYQETTIKTYLELAEHLPFYYVDITQIEDLEAFKDKFNLSYQTSPTTYYISGGEVIDTLVGVKSLEELQAFIEKQS